MLGAGPLAARVVIAATSSPFDLAGIDHVTLSVVDVDKSVAFYARIYGNTVMKDHGGPNSYVKMGPNYLAIARVGKGRVGPGAYQIGLGVRNFQLAEVKHSLDQVNIAHHEVKGQGVLVTDPDGNLIQFWAANSWNELAKTASPVSIPASEEPLLRPMTINHLLLAVSDTAKSTAFYEKLLGPARITPARPKDNFSERISFRAGKYQFALAPLNQGIHASGQLPSVDHFGIQAAFDRERLVKELQGVGAKVLPPIENGAGVDFLDPDSIRTQVEPLPKI